MLYILGRDVGSCIGTEGKDAVSDCHIDFRVYYFFLVPLKSSDLIHFAGTPLAMRKAVTALICLPCTIISILFVLPGKGATMTRSAQQEEAHIRRVGLLAVELAHTFLSSSARSSALRPYISKPVTSVHAFLPCLILITTEIGFTAPFLKYRAEFLDRCIEG
jgi:hypothetical protein